MSACGACGGTGVEYQDHGPGLRELLACELCRGVGDLCDGWLDCPRCADPPLRALIRRALGCAMCGGRTIVPCDRRVTFPFSDGRSFCTFHAALAT